MPGLADRVGSDECEEDDGHDDDAQMKWSHYDGMCGGDRAELVCLIGINDVIVRRDMAVENGV